MINRSKFLPNILSLLLLITLAACSKTTPPPPTSIPVPAATDTPLPSATPEPTSTFTPIPSETLAPTEPPPPMPTEPAAPTATRKKEYTQLIGDETSLGSGSDKSKVAVYITGGRIMVYTKGFKVNVILVVKVSINHKWNELGRVQVSKNSEQTLSVDLPTSLYGEERIPVCLKSMKSSEQNCYSVPNPGAQ